MAKDVWVMPEVCYSVIVRRFRWLPRSFTVSLNVAVSAEFSPARLCIIMLVVLSDTTEGPLRPVLFDLRLVGIGRHVQRFAVAFLGCVGCQ